MIYTCKYLTYSVDKDKISGHLPHKTEVSRRGGTGTSSSDFFTLLQYKFEGNNKFWDA